MRRIKIRKGISSRDSVPPLEEFWIARMLLNRDLKGIYESPYWVYSDRLVFVQPFFMRLGARVVFARFAAIGHGMQPADAAAQAVLCKEETNTAACPRLSQTQPGYSRCL